MKPLIAVAIAFIVLVIYVTEGNMPSGYSIDSLSTEVFGHLHENDGGHEEEDNKYIFAPEVTIKKTSAFPSSWLEKVQKFENAPLYCGALEKSVVHTDRLVASVDEVGYGVTKGEMADAKRFGILPKNAKLPKSMTKEEADRWFQNVTIPTYTKCVESVVKKPLSKEQKFALISFTHNLGEGKLRTLLSHKTKDIPATMKKYVYASGKVAKGLEKRRAWEASLWESNTRNKKSSTIALR